jgi:cytoskeletal protein RodZ
MSQKKVDEYKKMKKNRQKIMRREKIVRRIEILAIVVVLGGLITWFSVAVYKQSKADAEANQSSSTIDLNLDDIQNYLSDLSTSVQSQDTESQDSTSTSVSSGSTVTSESASSSVSEAG